MSVSGVDEMVVLGIGVAAGIALVAYGLSPTGNAAIDLFLLVIGTTFVIWCAASAPWWAGVVAAGVSVALADSFWILPAVAAVVGGVLIGRAQRAVPWSRALVAAAAIQAFAHARHLFVFGGNAIAVLLVLVALTVLGIKRRPRALRKRIWFGLGGVIGLGVLALVGLVVAGTSARPDLERGNRAAHEGIDALAAGDFDAARASMKSAAKYLDSARDDLGGVLAKPSVLIPGIAQNRNSAVDLVEGAASAADTIAEQLQVIDFDSLRVVNGRIDVEAIAALQGPLGLLNNALQHLSNAVTDAENPWIVSPLRRKLVDLQHDVDKQLVNGDRALAVLQQAPNILGAHGKRVYFIAFTTPSEARGLGGFMGNWAELTVDDGKLEMTAFGPDDDLTAGARANPKPTILTGLDEFLKQYGNYGFDTPPDGHVKDDNWLNISLSPNFPTVAKVISQFYPQSGGQHVDGVFVLDVYSIAALIDLTGPVKIDGVDEELTGDNAVDFLLNGQYLHLDTTERYDVLDQVAGSTVKRLFSTTLPPPQQLGKIFGPLASSGRLSAWAERPEEEAVFERLGMAGTLPMVGGVDANGKARGNDAIAVTLNNGSGNKIEYYLKTKMQYSVHPAVAPAVTTATVTVDLHNTAPSTGLPDYVIYNVHELPRGTNREYISLFSELPVTAVKVDGKDAPVYQATEDGLHVTSVFVVMPSGGSATIEMQLAGTLAPADQYSLSIRNPPAVGSFDTTVLIDDQQAAKFDSAGTRQVHDAAPKS